MPLIESDALLNRFGGLLGASTKVDIAVAWARSGPAVERLLLHARRARIRIAVGLSGNTTEPKTLRRLLEEKNVELRIAPAPQDRAFHPKFYRFRGEQGAVCWIGSANFTQGGFGGNTELVHEFRDRRDLGGEWFEGLWNDLDEDPEPEIAHYEERYTERHSGGYIGGGPASPGSLPRLEDIETWGEFVDALHVLDEYCNRQRFGWDVLGETHSYLHTIRVAGKIARRKDWDDFSPEECNILLGLKRKGDHTGAWDLLGGLGAVGTIVSAFGRPGKPKVRSHVLKQVQRVVKAEEAGFVEDAQSALAKIMELYRFGPAATRFLVLARPSRLVSVNGESAPGLGAFANMKSDKKHLAENYGELLKKIHTRKWYLAPEPVNRRDREIWRCRAALVDAFAYISARES